MAIAVVRGEQMVVQGTTGGFASSTKAELMGLIAKIITTTGSGPLHPTRQPSGSETV